MAELKRWTEDMISAAKLMEEKKWLMQTVTALAWILSCLYATLWFGRIVYVIAEVEEIVSWLQNFRFQQLLNAGILLAFPLIPDLVIGVPAFLLFGFVRVQAQKQRSNQASEPAPTNCPFSVAPPVSEPSPPIVVGVAHF